MLSGGEPDEIALKPPKLVRRAQALRSAAEFASHNSIRWRAKLSTSGGDQHPYDVCVFATGSSLSSFLK